MAVENAQSQHDLRLKLNCFLPYSMDDWKNKKWKYWTITMEYSSWQKPENVESLSVVKYIRGQLEFDTKHLHWQIAIQCFEPTHFDCVRVQFGENALVKPIDSLAAWEDIWKYKTCCEGTQFELGDKSNPIDTISKTNVDSDPNPVVPSHYFNIHNLEKKLINITENIYFLPDEALRILWNAIGEAEMIELMDSIDLQGYDDYIDLDLQKPEKILGLLSPPKKENIVPKNHGKKWEKHDIEELDILLKLKCVTLEEIAEKLNRTQRAIELKTIERVMVLIKSGVVPEKAFKIYRDRVNVEMLNEFNELRSERSQKRKRTTE
ncbi:hypothetical protein BC833DRAFT_570059 [Globomyces pollinis-pini]|nr:hypothetical protein BC833DRAFT_570059 [Globomyces pollinis-pini]